MDSHQNNPNTKGLYMVTGGLLLLILLGAGGIVALNIFRVPRAATQPEMMVALPSLGGEISQLQVEEHVQQDGEEGLRIRLSFSIEQARGVPIMVQAVFYTPDGNVLQDSNGKNASPCGMVSAFGPEITAKQAVETFTDYELFMPYAELELAGQQEAMFQVRIYDVATETTLAFSDYQHFVAPAP